MRLCCLAVATVLARKYIVMFRMPEEADMRTMRAASAEHTARTERLFLPGDRIDRKLLSGYYAQLTERTLRLLRKDSAVALVEEDRSVKIEAFGAATPRLKREYVFPFGFVGISYYGTDGTGPSLQDAAKPLDEILSFVLQKDAPWGISRISGHRSEYEYVEDAGKRVRVYVLDTGIDTDHPEFENRAVWGYNAVGGSRDVDDHGHGTHCAGTIGGKTYGIAKAARLVAVKVLNSKGEGLISSLIDGIDFVMKDYEKTIDSFHERESREYLQEDKKRHHLIRGGDRRTSSHGLRGTGLWSGIKRIFTTRKERPRAVVNMSIGGIRSGALNFAVQYASKFLGIHFVTAAGNERENACDFSPASAPNAITVGASDSDNAIAVFSNIGACVDIYAPGVDILSAWPGRGARMASGTSMAAPHVAGVMAVYLGLAHLTPPQLKERILKDSVGVVSDRAHGDALRIYKISGSLSGFLEFWPFDTHEKTDGKPMISLAKLYKRLKASE